MVGSLLFSPRAEAATVGCFWCVGSVEGVGRREKALGGKRPGARQGQAEAVFLVPREKPRFERIFAAKMTGLPHAPTPAAGTPADSAAASKATIEQWSATLLPWVMGRASSGQADPVMAMARTQESGLPDWDVRCSRSR